MSVSLSPLGKMQFNQGGIPLEGGRLFTYAAGTNTKLATYTDSTGGTPNTNPIILNANGECSIWLTDGSAYKLVLAPSTDTDPPTNAYWTQDQVANVQLNPTLTTLAVTGNMTVGGTLNKITFTQPAAAATLTLANNSTFNTAGAFTSTFTFTGTSTLTFPTSGTLALNNQATDTFGALTDITTNNVSATAHGFCPKFPNNTTTYFRGDGTFAVVPVTVVRSARTSNTILAITDNSNLIDITSGTFTQTFTAAATLGTGWYVWIRNSGTGDITLDPNASELIDGLTSFVMYPGEARLVQCDGTAFTSVVVHPFYRKATSTFTFVMPPGYTEIEVDGVGGGGQGGSGRRGAAGTVRSGGGAGGSPGRVVRKLRNIAAGTSTTVTIGAGGTTGGAAVTVDSTNGNDGQAGGNTTFGTLMTAFGGAAGKAGTGTGTGVVTSGSGSLSAGTSNNTDALAVGGGPSLTGSWGSGNGSGTTSNFGEGGGGAFAAAGGAAGNTELGGASPAHCDITSTTVVNSGSAVRGVSAASQGGWITSVDTLPATAPTAGLNGTYSAGGGATGGTCGAAPTVGGTGSAAATDDVCGNPGAGGGSTITAGQTGKAGGPGGLPGGPGGGGGAVLNGQNSGAGGIGANGQAIIKGVC